MGQVRGSCKPALPQPSMSPDEARRMVGGGNCHVARERRLAPWERVEPGAHPHVLTYSPPCRARQSILGKTAAHGKQRTQQGQSGFAKAPKLSNRRGVGNFGNK